MKQYHVSLVADAVEDLAAIYKRVSRYQTKEKARVLLGQLKECCQSLSSLAERGHLPPELERIAVLHYREIHHLHYRIIYQVEASDVYIHCILDGRRDMQSLLDQRFLRL